jgi:hypothetical protein
MFGSIKISQSIAVSFLFLSLMACHENRHNDTQRELNNSIAKWQQQQITNYLFTSEISCFCIPSDSVVNVVESGQIVSGYYTGSGQPLSADELVSQRTIQGYFDFIQQAIDEDAYSIEVTYDANYGFPRVITIDYDQNMADEEIGYRVSGFSSDIEDLALPSLEAQLVLKDQFGQEVTRFIQGEDITLELSVTNTSDVDALITFPSSAQYDFYIEDLDANEVWRWTDELVFLTVLTELAIEAGETFQVQETWNQVLSNNEPLPTGSFQAYGSLLQFSNIAETELIVE